VKIVLSIILFAVEEHLKDAKGGTPTYFQNNGGRATGYSNYPVPFHLKKTSTPTSPIAHNFNSFQNNFSPNNNQVNGIGTPRDNFNGTSNKFSRSMKIFKVIFQKNIQT